MKPAINLADWPEGLTEIDIEICLGNAAYSLGTLMAANFDPPLFTEEEIQEIMIQRAHENAVSMAQGKSGRYQHISNEVYHDNLDILLKRCKNAVL